MEYFIPLLLIVLSSKGPTDLKVFDFWFSDKILLFELLMSTLLNGLSFLKISFCDWIGIIELFSRLLCSRDNLSFLRRVSNVSSLDKSSHDKGPFFFVLKKRMF